MKVNTFELLRRCTVEHDWTVAPDGVEAMLGFGALNDSWRADVGPRTGRPARW